jgi:hypothetical protein
MFLNFENHLLSTLYLFFIFLHLYLDMHLSIQSSNKTIKEIFRNFDIELKNHFPTIEEYNNLKFKLFNCNYGGKYNLEKNKCKGKKSVQIKDLCVGDFVEIEYIPPSIKYLKDYPDLRGIVIYIDHNNHDGLIYSIEGETEIIYSIARDYCGYGYDYSHILFYNIRKFE